MHMCVCVLGPYVKVLAVLSAMVSVMVWALELLQRCYGLFASIVTARVVMACAAMTFYSYGP